jgi:hypothetical protein
LAKHLPRPDNGRVGPLEVVRIALIFRAILPQPSRRLTSFTTNKSSSSHKNAFEQKVYHNFDNFDKLAARQTDKTARRFAP